MSRLSEWTIDESYAVAFVMDLAASVELVCLFSCQETADYRYKL
jgi:hypothetical protein